MDTNALKPTISRRDQSSTAVQRAPDWLMKATLPRRAMPAAKVALTPLMGFITPRQFGPTRRMLPRRAWASTCRSSSTPAGPVSLKPAEMTTAPGMPRSAASPMMPGMIAAGVVTTTRSGFSGRLASLGYALIPSTLGRVGLTG